LRAVGGEKDRVADGLVYPLRAAVSFLKSRMRLVHPVQSKHV